MPRPTRGSVIAHEGRDGLTYRSLRFTAYGRRRRVPLGAVSDAEAQAALRHTLADVERGVWKPPATAQPPPEIEPTPTFHEFAEEWWTLRVAQFAPSTLEDYGWRLQVHLIPYFGEMPLDAISFDTVERYIAAKLAAESPLAPRSINMTLVLLAAVMESALERELIARNPAKGKARRVRERTPPRSYLEDAAQIAALLAAAGELDERAGTGPYQDRRHVERRAMLAVLIFAGLRVGELCKLRWRDVDLAGGWLSTGSKTEAGYRKVKIRGALAGELRALRARHEDAAQGSYVFPTATGGQMSDDNLRSRVLGRAAVIEGEEVRRPGTGAVARANERLEADGQPPLPKLTPHSLRRTFCSLLYALGEDPGTVMDEMGHTKPELALRVYRQAMRRGEEERERLRALVEGKVVANETANEGGVSATEAGVSANSGQRASGDPAGSSSKSRREPRILHE
ncbi:MAG: tyrosine-type recombinase/integrase [Solirubrobacteraceae bacterium]